MNNQEDKIPDDIKALKVVGMYRTEEEAKAKAEELKQEGHSIVKIIQTSPGGVMGGQWTVNIPTEWDPWKKSKSIPCSYCKKTFTSMSDFFTCWNCDSLECIGCATRRIFDGKQKITPSFIGKCRNCGGDWGFFNVSPTVRMQLAAKQPAAKLYFGMGMAGSALADIALLGLEIDELNQNTENIAKNLVQMLGANYDTWCNFLQKISDNYKRMDLSLTFMIEKQEATMKSFKEQAASIKDIAGPLYKGLKIKAQIFGTILQHLIKVLKNERNLDYFITNASMLENKIINNIQYFSQTQREAFNVILNSDKFGQIWRDGNFNLISRLIQELIVGEAQATVKVVSTTQKDQAPTESKSSLVNKAIYLYEQRDFVKSLSVLLEADKLYPNDFDINKWLGLAYDRFHKYKEAAERFEIADRIRPNDEAVLEYWAYALYDIERYEEAKEKAEALERIKGTAHRKSLDELLDHYDRLIKQNFVYWTRLNNEGCQLLVLGKVDWARKIGEYLVDLAEKKRNHEMYYVGEDLLAAALARSDDVNELRRADEIFNDVKKNFKATYSEHIHQNLIKKLQELEKKGEISVEVKPEITSVEVKPDIGRLVDSRENYDVIISQDVYLSIISQSQKFKLSMGNLGGYRKDQCLITDDVLCFDGTNEPEDDLSLKDEDYIKIVTWNDELLNREPPRFVVGWYKTWTGDLIPRGVDIKTQLGKQNMNPLAYMIICNHSKVSDNDPGIRAIRVKNYVTPSNYEIENLNFAIDLSPENQEKSFKEIIDRNI